jgi:hypothetical protein
MLGFRMTKAWMAVLLVAGCGSGPAGGSGAAATMVAPPARAGTSPARWEYLCETLNYEQLVGAVNDAGAKGWELVSVSHQDVFHELFCFKRPLS